MAYFDLVMDSQEINISSEYIIANDFRQTRGFYYLNGEKKYCRKDSFFLNITLIYIILMSQKIKSYFMDRY